MKREKKVVDAAAKVHSALEPGLLKSVYEVVLAKELKLGYLLNFGASLMKDGLKRMINGLEDRNLGVFGSSREPKRNGQQDGDLNSESPHSSS